MKRLCTLFLALAIYLSGYSRILYLSPTGNDNNTGTITSPFFSLEKAWTVIVPGDTVYLRGGTYQYDNMQYLAAKNGTAANLIKIWAYPGEQPNITKHPSYVFDGNNIDLIYFEGNYFHFKGIEISNFPHINGQPAWSAFRAGFANYCIFERINYHHNAAGFSIRGNSTGNLVLNSDFHHNMDPYTVPAYDGADGLNITYNVPGNTNTIRGCRAWWNGDDGFDVWENNGYVLIENCWSFYNGYIPGTFNTAGNGSGFKLGSTSAQPTTLLRTVQNCLAFKNRSFGFVENAANCMIRLYNNTSVQHGVYGYWFGAWFPNAIISRNNISQNNSSDQFNTQSTVTNNSWQNGLTVTNADFQSTDDSQLVGARQADGSLPVITFLHLASGSDLIDKGMNVGLGFLGSAPDLGTWEYSPGGNILPIANAGPDINISLPTVLATLNGSGTDPDGTIASYQWRKISGPALFNILTPLQAITIVNSLLVGAYQFELTVTDNLGGTDRDTVSVTVNLINQPPVANAGADKNITLPTNSITQAGSGTDPDGSIASYQWTKVSGPAQFTIVSPTQATTVINNLAQGVYQFELQVTDDLGATGIDTMVITVNAAANQPPTANAGADKNITLPANNITQNGSGTDPDGTITSFQWTKVAGPTQFTIASPTQATTVINNLVQGIYQFELTVTDNLGATDVDTMTVTVNAPANQPPVANAGTNKNITLPINSVTQVGSGTDPDGTIVSYLWTKISGPSQFTIVSPTQATTVINNLVQGVYQFRLRVTDDLGATDVDNMVLTVNAAVNQAPTANAGANMSITLPTNSISVVGSGTDPDGTIASYQWTKIAGPTQFTIVSPTQATTVINNLVQGVYQFQLTVTDNLGAVGSDIMILTVNAAPNQLPTADAGADKNITLPTNSITQVGSGTDPDGTIASYQWTKIAGPTQFTIVSATQATTVINNLVQGVYQFQLTVTDNQGGTGTDIMVVTVNTAANQSPIANAGGNQNITLPTNSVTQSGSGTDPDGTIASYQWTKIAGPAQFTIVSATQATTVINNLVQGVYQFQLTVTDNLGATGSDVITITVNAAANQPPVANAGADKNITLPTNSVTQVGSGTDPDGTIASYQWTKISGPTQFTIVSPTQSTTVINNLVQGVYQFQLTVTDNLGATDGDIMIVTVSPAANQAPTANAGTDNTITLPTNSVTQVGSGTDPDGTIASYQWTKIAGPTQFTIVSPTLATTVINNLVQGVYQFQLTVTDNQGATDADVMTITVNPAPNQSPVANAGPDANITLPINSVIQVGSGTDPDGAIASYQWTKISGPTQFTIVSPTQATTVINNLVQGIYQFELTVTDNLGATAVDVMTITVNAASNLTPIADAGADKNITLPTNSVTQVGSGTDPDGTIASYQWTKIAGPTQFTIVSPTLATTVINNLVQGVYQFQLTVTDNLGATGVDIMIITVNAAPNQAPTANAGANKNITLPTNSVTQVGSGTDPDGTIASYQWTKIAGPTQFTIVSPTQATTVINNLVQGVYQFQLTVTDNLGATGSDIMIITVNPAANQPPIANAGGNKSITLPTNSVTQVGSGADPDGTIASYQWTKIAGPTQFTIVSPTQATTVINNLVQGVYQFQLTVTDNLGATDGDIIIITVNAAPNQVPTANAGADKNITLPTNSVTQVGSGTDPDGTIVSYQWTKIAGPTQFTIVSPTQATTVINNLVQGVYQFQLTVTDNQGATDADIMVITVNPAPNQAPAANAGSNKNITLPTNSVTQVGSGTDPDGTIVSYQWTKIAGPTQFTIVSPTQATTVINNLVQGVYQFQLTVTDNQGATDADIMVITVNPAVNQVPTANAGADKNITLPTNSVTQVGSGTDPDGTIVSYQWTKIAGPTQFTIVSPTQATTVINNLVQGVYQFQLTVTDNSGATDGDIMVINVNPAPNQAPTANAGADKNITLPVNSITQVGSGVDPDGTIVSYQWTQIAGPAQFTIVSPTLATTVINNLVQGVYQFQLTVTDNQGATDADIMVINVNPAPNQPPVANAGTDKNITLPTNTITQVGSGTDPDGTIASYQWTKIAGPAQFAIVSPTQSTTVINNLVQGVYQFQLRVADNLGAPDLDTMTVTVNAAPNQPPVANAGSDKNITLPINSVTQAGSGTDPDGTITSYQWTKVAGPAQFAIVSPTQATTVINNLVQGIYQFELRVTDNQGATDTDTMIVTVNAAVNQPPIANAGTDKNITLPANSVTQVGSGTDPDGTIVSYQWAKIAGPTQFTIVSPTQATTDITNLAQGVYQFRLTVTDNLGATASDIAFVVVNAIPLSGTIAIAGPDQIVDWPNTSTTLNGRGLTIPSKTITSYLWTKISGPAQLNIVAPTQPITFIDDLLPGIYVFELKVTDNVGGFGKDSITIEVKEETIAAAGIYPNPATDVLNVRIVPSSNTRIDPGANKIGLTIYDFRGAVVYRDFLPSQPTILKQIDISRFIPGVFIIELRYGGKRQIFKFIKARP